MTRPSQKERERYILEALLKAIDMECEEKPDSGERPDFIVRFPQLIVGIEVTMFQSNKTSAGGVQRRAIESSWEQFEIFSREFRNHHKELKGTHILLRFKDSVPARQQDKAFLQEILEFVCLRQTDLDGQYRAFWRPDFTSASPLMIKYLKDISLKRCETGEVEEWQSNVMSGFVDSPAHTISRIVERKSAKVYRILNELWLVIERSGRPSEMILPISGVDEFNTNAALQRSLIASPFARVYVFTAMGLFVWEKIYGEWELQNG
jgi:hypothetical protein